MAAGFLFKERCMSAKNPFDDLFDQLQQTLSFIEKHMNVPFDDRSVPEDVEKQLKKLKKKVDLFNRLSEDIVSLSGVSDEELKMRLQGVAKNLPQEGKELLNKGESVLSHAQTLSGKVE